MEIIKQLFEEHGSELTQKLEATGFSTEQAGKFLPQAASSFAESAQSADLGAVISSLSAGTGEHFNIEVIAQKLGMNSDMISAGISAIAPVFLPHLMHKNAGVAGTIAGLASNGSLFNAAKKLFS
ncbi:MAG: hypothetical protein H8E21_12580 [Gammaproteobacteria bacterium]|nr:hypothetical protein [Gammaproteobacteria bacterium]MBL6998359.1 hypothetical protein [Gammaproteobacteria bacterium]